MGNFFAQPEESKYPETLDQEGVLEILTLLGNVQGPTVDNNPAEITNPRFNSYCPLATHLSEISVSDPELLNETLETIADSIIEKLSSAEKVVEVYPKESEKFLFKCGHLGQVRPDKEGNYQDYQVQEYLKREVGGVERIKRILRGFSVYQFKNDSLTAVSRAAKVPIEDVYVGLHNGEFMTYAPRVSPEISDCLKITWWVYELDDGSIIPLPGTGGGVTLNENSWISVLDVSGLRELLKWSREGNEESLTRYEKWYTMVMENGQCWALCGGEVEGDLVELEDFLDRVDTSGDVFEEEAGSGEEEAGNGEEEDTKSVEDEDAGSVEDEDAGSVEDVGEEPPDLKELSLDD